MHNGEGMKERRLCKTAFAAICESKNGSKSATDSEKVGVCSELKSSKSSISSVEDIEDFGTKPHSFKFSVIELGCKTKYREQTPVVSFRSLRTCVMQDSNAFSAGLSNASLPSTV